MYQHPPNIIKNLPGNISKIINTLSADETNLLGLKIYATIHWPKVDLNIRLHFKSSITHPQ